MISIDVKQPHDELLIEALLDTRFGPERCTKASYALRETEGYIPELNFVARYRGAKDNRTAAALLVGTVSVWKICLKDMLTNRNRAVLLLGPLAADKAFEGQAIGARLIKQALDRSVKMGCDTVMLVGEMPYYGRFGFRPVRPCCISLPGGRDMDRLLVWQTGAGSSLPAVGKLLPFEAMMPRLSIRPEPPTQFVGASMTAVQAEYGDTVLTS